MSSEQQHYQCIRLVLGDQLNANHAWFQKPQDNTLIVIAELPEEATYVTHHVQKVCAFFAAMAAFASDLDKLGHHTRHLTLDQTTAYATLPALLDHLIATHQATEFHYQRPDEYRLCNTLRKYRNTQANVSEFDTEHYLLPFAELGDYFTAGQAMRMESFYRKMRQRFGILMSDNKPESGQWNFDADNRNKLKAKDLADIPEPLIFANPVEDILERLDRHQVKTIGRSQAALLWPVNREQSLALLSYFCEHCLPRFGQFQDAMTQNSTHQWSLYHSRLSFSMNVKLLSPLEVIQAAVTAWRDNAHIDLAQVEGFVRQILGWREFVRGMYWANMPEYASQNALGAERPLPDWFWTGETKMNCLSHCINQSLDLSYAHHIQRLMVTGTFSLIAGIHPDEVDAWYLGIYNDALEWVEMPNTRGMSQFADGGLIASKPYAASGNYINKMSDYCKDCHYNVKEKAGSSACPYNSLYWDFMVRHREKFGSNPRTSMVYRNWDKQDEATRNATLEQATEYLKNLDSL